MKPDSLQNGSCAPGALLIVARAVCLLRPVDCRGVVLLAAMGLRLAGGVNLWQSWLRWRLSAGSRRLGTDTAEHPAVNRWVDGSSPAGGANFLFRNELRAFLRGDARPTTPNNPPAGRSLIEEFLRERVKENC